MGGIHCVDKFDVFVADVVVLVSICARVCFLILILDMNLLLHNFLRDYYNYYCYSQCFVLFISDACMLV